MGKHQVREEKRLRSGGSYLADNPHALDVVGRQGLDLRRPLQEPLRLGDPYVEDGGLTQKRPWIRGYASRATLNPASAGLLGCLMSPVTIKQLAGREQERRR